jgi:iron complex outermembrane receptor protein
MEKSKNKAGRDELTSAQHPEASKKSAYTLTPLTAAIVAALHPGADLAAQEVGDQANKEAADKILVEEVIVTATKRAESLQEVPQSITAFSGLAIEKMQFKNMEDYLKALPSAALTSSLPGRNSLVMRGVSTGAYEYRTESQVAVYLDEQPITSISQQPEVRMVDIARVENLPGPQGTLFGSSSQSGTLRIITNKPNFDGFSGEGNATFATTHGGDPSWDFSGHVNIPVSDSLAFRIVGFSAHEGGYVDNVYGTTYAGPGAYGSPGDNAAVADNNQNTYDISGGRIAGLWKINDDWETDFGVILQKSEAEGTWETDPYLGDYKITRFFDEWRDDKWWQTSVTVRGDLGFAEFVSTTSYFERDSAYEWDNMQYNQWQTSYYGIYNAWLPYDFEYEFGTIFNDQVQTRFAQEFRLTSQGDSKLQWMLGAFYDDVYDRWYYGAKIPNFTQTTAWTASNYYACYYAAAGYDAPCPIPPTDITYWNHYARTVKQTAVFGEISYDLTNKLTATVGGRWFRYDRTERQQYYTPYGSPPFGSYGKGEGFYEGKGSEGDTITKFSLKYQANDNFMAYVTRSEGFRLGGRNSPRVVASDPNIPEKYDADTLVNYEVGIKSEWLDRRLTINADVFRMKWDGIQINSRLGSAWWQRGTWNGKTGETRGFEINGTFRVTQNLTLEGSAYRAKAEYTSDSYSPYCPESEAGCEPWVFDGEEMPNSAKEKYWLAVEYTVPRAFGMPGELWFRYDTSYQGASWASLSASEFKDPNGRIPSWSSANFQVGVSLDNDWSITLMARNIWDENGVNNMFYSDSDIPENSSQYWSMSRWFGDPRWRNVRTLQKPRTISLSIVKKF